MLISLPEGKGKEVESLTNCRDNWRGDWREVSGNWRKKSGERRQLCVELETGHKQMHSHVKMRQNTMGNYASGIPGSTHTLPRIHTPTRTHTLPRTHTHSHTHMVWHTWANVAINKCECECDYNIMLLTNSRYRKRHRKRQWKRERENKGERWTWAKANYQRKRKFSDSDNDRWECEKVGEVSENWLRQHRKQVTRDWEKLNDLQMLCK